MNQMYPLQQLKRDMIFLLFARDNIQLQNNDLLKEVERIIIEKEHIKKQSLQETDS